MRITLAERRGRSRQREQSADSSHSRRPSRSHSRARKNYLDDARARKEYVTAWNREQSPGSWANTQPTVQATENDSPEEIPAGFEIRPGSFPKWCRGIAMGADRDAIMAEARNTPVTVRSDGEVIANAGHRLFDLHSVVESGTVLPSIGDDDAVA